MKTLFIQVTGLSSINTIFYYSTVFSEVFFFGLFKKIELQDTLWARKTQICLVRAVSSLFCLEIIL